MLYTLIIQTGHRICVIWQLILEIRMMPPGRANR